jgi:hypothetical protein
MEDIMNKLVSRDILYEPIKEMRELVSWLLEDTR